MIDSSDNNEKFIANCFINKDANQSRDDFLERIEHIKFIRTGNFKAFSLLPKSEKDVVAIDQFYSAINKGNYFNSTFPFLETHPAWKSFGMYVPIDLFNWFSRNSIQTIHKQIVLYNACIYYCNEIANPPFITLKKEIDQLKDLYFISKDLWNYDQIVDAYNEAAHDYYHSQVPSFLSLQNEEDNKEDIIVRAAYFSHYDWALHVLHKTTKGILWRDFSNKTGLKPKSEERDDLVDLPDQYLDRIYEDNLGRSGSDDDTWSKWLLTFRRYPMTQSHIFHLHGEDSAPGYIYIIKGEVTHLSKIGWTANSDVEVRKRQIDTSSAEHLEKVGFFPVASQKTENTIHDIFSKKRVKGEWFNLTDKDISNLLSSRWRRSNHIY